MTQDRRRRCSIWWNSYHVADCLSVETYGWFGGGKSETQLHPLSAVAGIDLENWLFMESREG
jgi:hypothetical protein